MTTNIEATAVHRRLRQAIAKSLGRGALLLLPLMITIWLIQFTYQKMDGLLQPMISGVVGREVSGLSFGIIVVALLVVGAASSALVFRTPGYLIERGIMALPGVGSIYSTTKKLMPGSDTGTGDTGFNTVVRVEYPRRGVWSVGFLMAVIKDDQGSDHGVVYMPSTPMPQSGWLVQVPMTEIQSIDWNSGEAMQYIVTAGVTCPTSMAIGKLEI